MQEYLTDTINECAKKSIQTIIKYPQFTSDIEGVLYNYINENLKDLVLTDDVKNTIDDEIKKIIQKITN